MGARLAWLVALAWVAGTVQAADLKPCRIPGLSHEVQCGTLPRPLDPAQPQGTQIDLNYVVVPALARRKLPDPVFLLAGGPGQSAIGVAGQVMPLFARLNNRRDIVFVDQRGTGRSAPLECDSDPRQQPLAELADPGRQLAQLHSCRERLQKLPHGELVHYTTPVAMQDLDAVRRELGAAQINLVGVSYGTRAALDYLRQFPQAVRRVVLDGVAPPDMVLPASFGVDAQAAFESLLRFCEADDTCRRLHPRLRADWLAWLARLPQPVTLQHPLTGAAEPLTLTREMVAASVRSALYSPTLSQALPAAMHAATQGRPQALLTLGMSLAPRKGGAVAMGMHFSVLCSEDLTRPIDAAAMRDSTARSGEFAEGYEVYERVCADWPRRALPADFYTMPTSPAAVLLLSGGLDPVTPPRHAERAAKALGGKARHVVVPNVGHGVLAVGCMPDLLARFIAAADERTALAIDMACVQGVPRPPVFQPTGGPT